MPLGREAAGHLTPAAAVCVALLISVGVAAPVGAAQADDAASPPLEVVDAAGDPTSAIDIAVPAGPGVTRTLYLRRIDGAAVPF